MNFNGLFFLEARYLKDFPSFALLIDFSFIHKTLVLEKIVNEGSAIVIHSQLWMVFHGCPFHGIWMDLNRFLKKKGNLNMDEIK